MDLDINVNIFLSWIILGIENSEEWLVVVIRFIFMLKNYISNRFDLIVVFVLNFFVNNFRIIVE